MDKKQKVLVVEDEPSLQQAARASDFTAFFNMGEDRAGYLVEYGDTNELLPARNMN